MTPRSRPTLVRTVTLLLLRSSCRSYSSKSSTARYKFEYDWRERACRSSVTSCSGNNALRSSSRAFLSVYESLKF